MKFYNFKETEKRPRIDRLVKNLFAKMPEIEADRAVLLTEAYKNTENLPIIERRAKAFSHILKNIPIIISLIPEYALFVRFFSLIVFLIKSSNSSGVISPISL